MSMHCNACLGGDHKGCRIMLPVEWEDDSGRCVCKCANRKESRLCNVERKCEELRAKPASQPRRKPGPKARTGEYAGPVRPTKWTDDRIMNLVVLEKAGHTSRQIGEIVGSHMDTVRTYLKVARLKGWR